MIGKNILHYHIQEKLGEGGMSQNHPRIHKDERRVVLRIPMNEVKSGGIE